MLNMHLDSKQQPLQKGSTRVMRHEALNLIGYKAGLNNKHILSPSHREEPYLAGLTQEQRL